MPPGRDRDGEDLEYCGALNFRGKTAGSSVSGAHGVVQSIGPVDGGRDPGYVLEPGAHIGCVTIRRASTEYP